MYRFYSGDDWLLNYELFDHWYFLDDWDLNVLFDLSGHFLYHFDQLSLHLLHLFYHLLNHQLLSNDLHLLDLSYHIVHLLNYLNFLDYFFDLFLCLHNRNDLFNNTIHNLVLGFNMIFYFSGASILYNWNNLFNYLFNLDHLWHFYNFFNYLFDEDRHFDNLLYHFLDRHYFLNDDLYSFYFSLNVIYDSIHLHWNFYFHYLFPHHLDFHDLRHYLLKLDDLFNDGGNLHDCLHFLLVWN